MSVTCFLPNLMGTNYLSTEDSLAAAALLNFENDPADVRAAVPKELMRRTIC